MTLASIQPEVMCHEVHFLGQHRQLYVKKGLRGFKYYSSFVKLVKSDYRKNFQTLNKN